MAVTAAAGRGVPAPSTEHLLIALGEYELPARVLAELGVTSAQALVDAGCPVRPRPIPPIFERFTVQARAAVNTAAECARRAGDRWVEPVHLLSAVLDVEAWRGGGGARQV